MSEIQQPDTHFAVNTELAVYRLDTSVQPPRIKWLVGKRSHQEEHAGGDLVMPGGTVEPPRADKSGKGLLENTAYREALEEMGVTTGKPFYVGSDYFQTANGTPVLNVIFAAEHVSGTARPMDPAEMTTAAWLTLPEIEDNPNAQPWTVENLQTAERKVRENLAARALSSPL